MSGALWIFEASDPIFINILILDLPVAGVLRADQLGQQLLTELRARWLDALAAVAALHVNDNE